MYQNPYGSDDSLDPDAARRKALLDLMGTPAAGSTPTPSQALPSSRPAPVGLTTPGASRSTAANGADTPDAPDPVTNSGGNLATPPANPYASPDNGLQYGSKILDLYSEPYNRRGGGTGGIGSGALTGASIGSAAGPIGAGAGAAIGAIVGAAKKHAMTAPTDFSVNDAREIIKQSYRDMFGRDATDQEVSDALAGQGLKPGGEWVGQQGLMGVLGHLGENAAAERAAGGGTAGSSGATAGATPGGPLATNPNTGVAGGMDTSVSGPAAAGAASGSGVPANVEGVDAAKWNDPNKHDLKYDALHIIANAGSIDAAWPELQKRYPNAQRISGDVIDFGDGTGPVDLQRDAEHNGGFHWEPVNDASASAASAAPVSASGSSPLTLPGATQLAAPLTNNDVLQQILAELQRVQAGEAPRAAILSQMGLA